MAVVQRLAELNEVTICSLDYVFKQSSQNPKQQYECTEGSTWKSCAEPRMSRFSSKSVYLTSMQEHYIMVSLSKSEFVNFQCTKKTTEFFLKLHNGLSDPWERSYGFPLSCTDSLTFPRVEGSDSGMFYSSY